MRLANNVLTDLANEDWGCVGLSVGYAREIAIEHNELSNLSYSGISVGWGWTRTPTVLRNNVVRANLIHHIARACATPPASTRTPPTRGTSYITVRDKCPEERFLQNANGSGNVWENNGPGVSEEIEQAAGMEPAFRDVK